MNRSGRGVASGGHQTIRCFVSTPPARAPKSASSVLRELLSRAANPPTPEAAIEFDIVDAHVAIDKLGLYSHRLSRQFHKTLEQLRDIQAERRLKQERDLKRAAALLEMHKVKGIPYDPAADGFVFSSDEIETYSRRLIRLNQSRHIEHLRFYAAPGHALP